MLASALVLDLSTPFSPVAGASRRFAPSLKSKAQDPEDFARYLVLVVLDACRPEYFALAPMPNLESLAANGVTYTDAWTGSLVGTTGPAHVQMSTGTFPWRNGLFAMEWYDWELGKRVTPCTLEAVRRGEMARIVRESGVPTLAGLLKARYPNACVAATSAQKFYAAQGLGVGPADYILYSTPPPDLVPQALPGHIPSDKIMHDPRLRIRVKVPGDENIFAARAALALFQKYKPRMLLINLPAHDEYGHSTGGIIAPDVMRQITVASDQALGELMAAYQDAGLFPRTLWVVLADHGMIPNTHQVDPRVIRDIVREARARGIRGSLSLNIPFHYLRKPPLGTDLAEVIAQHEVSGLVGLYVKNGEGPYEYQAVPTTEAKIAPSLNQTYRYLMSTFAGRVSPDVVTVLGENTVVGTRPLNSHGFHRYVSWGAQHIPLILSGPGVLQGAVLPSPARLVDLAPTFVRLMGLPAANMDGIVLADALVAPTRKEVAAQERVTTFLAPLRDALKATSV